MIGINRLSITRDDANLGVAWHTASEAIPAANTELFDTSSQLEDVTTLGVDEHV